MNGLRVRTGVGGCGCCCWGSLLTGRSLLLGNPEAVVSESLLASLPNDEKGIRLPGADPPRLPDREVARGSSDGLLLSTGLRALLPVGTILNLVRVRVLEPDGPVAVVEEDGKRPLLLLNSLPPPELDES